MNVIIDGIVYAPKSQTKVAGKGVHYIDACEVTQAQSQQAIESDLYKRGDMKLVWVSEADIYANWNESPNAK